MEQNEYMEQSHTQGREWAAHELGAQTELLLFTGLTREQAQRQALDELQGQASRTLDACYDGSLGLFTQWFFEGASAFLDDKYYEITKIPITEVFGLLS